jgi:hypothetical protein
VLGHGGCTILFRLFRTLRASLAKVHREQGHFFWGVPRPGVVHARHRPSASGTWSAVRRAITSFRTDSATTNVPHVLVSATSVTLGQLTQIVHLTYSVQSVHMPLMGSSDSPRGPSVTAVAAPKDLVTTAQAAAHLGISRQTLGRYAKQGLLTPTRVLPSGHLRWNLEDIERQLKELREQGKGT